MDIILVPGFWLDASSWDEVTPPLLAAGHRVHPLTLPGLESAGAPRAGIGLRSHVDAVVATIDALDAPVVLVGHSGGGAIIHGAVDARPDRVLRAIYVDSGPLGDGGVINDDLPADGDEVPLPPWELFDDEDLTDLDDALRDMFRARAIPQPRGVAQDQQRLHDERRYNVPATVIACEFPSAMLIDMIGAGHPYVAELGRVREVDYVDLPTGHWPQFTRPAELGEAILAAVGRSS
ncbi:pimeloyl-ACP methyl ester carboxylesterase [Arthrobacter ginsengisoli]|uniref:Pimeloyl-ACP methyl ester carboxylesterase n=1 Tax=Arthrobacter ginsengisoli TaxID=1356565 RepID=A0ABU1U7J3_9MICC|nr:alpha/beta fold hydrolase [Arthrobacter ginsengisoli]MDR7081158.1 pimeloyl-ACP methyl ester carboxylesterase [Arthrobacter ginsengisoli]